MNRQVDNQAAYDAAVREAIDRLSTVRDAAASARDARTTAARQAFQAACSEPRQACEERLISANVQYSLAAAPLQHQFRTAWHRLEQQRAEALLAAGDDDDTRRAVRQQYDQLAEELQAEHTRNTSSLNRVCLAEADAAVSELNDAERTLQVQHRVDLVDIAADADFDEAMREPTLVFQTALEAAMRTHCPNEYLRRKRVESSRGSSASE